MSWNPFGRVGEFIKGRALILWVLGMLAGIIGGVVLVIKVDFIIGIVVMGVSAFVTTFSTMLLYAFGEITEKVVSIEEYLLREQREKIQQKNEQIAKKSEMPQKKQQVTKKNEAPKERNITNRETSEDVDLNEYVDFECPECGETVSFTRGELMNKKSKKCPFCDTDIF